MGVRLGRVYPVKFFGLNTGANRFMAWLSVTVWRWEMDLTWHRSV